MQVRRHLGLEARDARELLAMPRQRREAVGRAVCRVDAVAEGREGEYKAGIYQFPIDYTKVLLSSPDSLLM